MPSLLNTLKTLISLNFKRPGGNTFPIRDHSFLSLETTRGFIQTITVNYSLSFSQVDSSSYGEKGFLRRNTIPFDVWIR